MATGGHLCYLVRLSSVRSRSSGITDWLKLVTIWKLIGDVTCTRMGSLLLLPCTQRTLDLHLHPASSSYSLLLRPCLHSTSILPSLIVATFQLQPSCHTTISFLVPPHSLASQHDSPEPKEEETTACEAEATGRRDGELRVSLCRIRTICEMEEAVCYSARMRQNEY